LHSITAKFKKSSSITQRILNCGNKNFHFKDDIFTYPEKIRINNGIKENYNNDDTYNLAEEENIVEYFWEDVIITNCAMMFYKCENIIEIDFSNFNTSNVNSTRQMFFGCINLKSLNLSNFDTSKVIYMIEMFYNCYSLTSLDLSNFNTSQVFHSYDSIRGGMFYMFYNCSSLVSLNLFNFQITYYIDNIFYKCESLSYINFGNATIEKESIISELNKVSSPNLCIIINNETLKFFNSLNVSFNFFFNYMIQI
jgi:surface protein